MVWSWNGAMPGEETTRVVFELTSEGERTRLVFRHEGPVLPREGAFRSGWARRLRALRDVAGTSYARRIVVAASTGALFDAVATVPGVGIFKMVLKWKSFGHCLKSETLEGEIREGRSSTSVRSAIPPSYMPAVACVVMGRSTIERRWLDSV